MSPPGACTPLALAAVLAAALSPAPATAVPGQPCGVADGRLREPLASDALWLLEAATGLPGRCGPCLCDADGDGRVAAPDALLVLKRAADGSTDLGCPDCTCRATLQVTDLGWGQSELVADVDGDGYDNVVSTNDRGTIYLRRGLGRAVFDAATTVAVEGRRETRVLAVGDLTEDGIADLVVTVRNDSREPRRLLLLPGLGDACFGEPIANEVSVTGRGELVDLNGDGTLGPPASYETFGNTIAALVADLDDDQVPDVAVANLFGSIVVYHGRSDGVLEKPRVLAVAGKPRALVAADFDRDGRLDILSANSKADNVGVLFGKGSGEFTSDVISPAGRFGIGLAVGDYDGDDAADLVLLGDRGWIGVHHGAGDGHFPNASARQHLLRDPQAVFRADLDGDSHDDVVILNSAVAYCSTYGIHEDFHSQGIDGDGVSVLLGQGDGTFGEERSVDGLVTRSIAVGDLDGDGTVDLVAVDDEARVPVFLRGLGDGSFERRGQAEVEPDTWRCTTSTVDGLDPRIACIAADAGRLDVFRVADDGGLVRTAKRALGLEVSEVLLGSLDGNAYADAVVVHADGSGVSSWLGRSNGRLGERVESTGIGTGFHSRLADLDGDGSDDLVTIFGGAAFAARGRAGGAFDQSRLVLAAIPEPWAGAGASVSAFAVVDADGNGLADIVGVNSRKYSPRFATILDVAGCVLERSTEP